MVLIKSLYYNMYVKMLKEHTIELNKSRQSLGAISKQLQVPRSTVPTTDCKHKGYGTVVSLP